MKQTKPIRWKQVDGDVNPIDYGGTLFDGETLYYFEGRDVLDTRYPNHVYPVYRFDPIDESDTWIKWNDVASCIGEDPDLSTLDGRIRATLDAVLYYGPREFDDYPFRYTLLQLFTLFRRKY